jgi:hypothetical protein
MMHFLSNIWTKIKSPFVKTETFVEAQIKNLHDLYAGLATRIATLEDKASEVVKDVEQHL